MTKTITAHVTDNQYELARRRAFVEDLSWKTIFNALINAYIAGDITVTQQGRYSVAIPESSTPVVHIRRDADTIELEPDWNVNDPRPQVGTTSSQQARPHNGWGTSALNEYIKQETGRKIPKQYLRRLLRTLGIEKAENGRWYFEGPNDPQVATILSAIESGVYDEMIRQGIDEMVKQVKPKEDPKKHEDKHQEIRRKKFMKRLKQLED